MLVLLFLDDNWGKRQGVLCFNMPVVNPNVVFPVVSSLVVVENGISAV